MPANKGASLGRLAGASVSLSHLYGFAYWTDSAVVFNGGGLHLGKRAREGGRETTATRCIDRMDVCGCLGKPTVLIYRVYVFCGGLFIIDEEALF